MDLALAFGAGVVVAYALFRSRTGASPPPSQSKSHPKSKDTKGGPAGRHKMVLVVRMDINMGKGKIAAQCGHATLGAYKRASKRKPEVVAAWSRGGQAKIALKCPDEGHMHELMGKAEAQGLITYLVADAGHTQVEAGTETVLAIGPAHEDAINAITGHLKLL